MKPILMDIPMPIETRRLVIRHPVAGDGPELKAAEAESFADLHIWTPWAKEPATAEETEEFVRQAHADFILRQSFSFLIFDRQSQVLVGVVALQKLEWSIPKFEIGYWVRKRFAGGGYITEATAAVSRFAFEVLQAKRLEIRCDVDNERGKAIPKRLGFAVEATLKHDDLKPNDGGLMNTVIFTRFDAAGLPDVGATWGGARKT